MGKGGSKQTVGYKYFLGEHMILCHGPIDSISRIRVDERVAWEGVSTGGQITIDAEGLFGGTKREGGISGDVDIEMGEPTQGQNDYLLARLGSTIPGYRGVVGAVLRQCYLGTNPYLKPWEFRGTRCFVRQDGIEQWYAAKAGIGSSVFAGKTIKLVWYQNTFVQSGGNDEARMGIGFYDATETLIGSINWSSFTQPTSWTQRTLEAVAPGNTFLVKVFVEMNRLAGTNNDGYIDHVRAFVNGAQLDLHLSLIDGWTNEIGALGIRDDNPEPYAGDYYLTGGTSAQTRASQQLVAGGILDMNPAHIIRECLTDVEWGMGYLETDIDDDSFEAAADQLFAESLGLSLLWDRQVKLEEFIEECLRHIDAALYVSRATGKFVLKLIRADYDEGDLITLDESNIIKIENPNLPQFSELSNSVTVNFLSNDTSKSDSVTVKDTALISMQGVEINASLQYPGFSSRRNALVAAQRDLRSLSQPLFSCTVLANHEAEELDIGSCFKLTWGKWQVNTVIMRVTGIAFGDGKRNIVKISCVEDVFGTNTETTVGEGSGGEWADPSGPPTPVSTQIAMEAPYFELIQRVGQTAIDLELTTVPEAGYAMAAAPRAGAAVNARLNVDSGAGYEDVATLDFCPTGALSTDISYKDTAVTLTNFDELDNVTIGTFAQIDDELVRVDSVDTVTGEITIGRGILDTVPAKHTAGTVVYFWDEYSGFDETQFILGETVDMKITPVSGEGSLDVADATAVSLELAQRAFRPYPPGDLKVNSESYEEDGYSGALTITWVARDRLLQTTSAFFDHFDAGIGPEAGTTYRVRVYIDDVLDDTEEPATSGFVASPSESGLCRIEVDSKRDGVYSLFAATHEFPYLTSGSTRIEEEGALRYTEDGAFRATED